MAAIITASKNFQRPCEMTVAVPSAFCSWMSDRERCISAEISEFFS